MQHNFIILILASLITFSATPCNAVTEITLVDSAGKTQSAVELKPDGTATISATMSYGEARMVPAGTIAELVRISGSRRESIARASAEKTGEVSFPNVTAGTYVIKIVCDEFTVDEAKFSTEVNQYDDSGLGQDDAREQIVVQDISGVSRAAREIAPGNREDLELVTNDGSGSGFSGVKATLVTIEGDKRTDVAATAAIDKKGRSSFTNLPAGVYQVEYDCQAQTQSVAVTGNDILNVICPVSIAG